MSSTRAGGVITAFGEGGNWRKAVATIAVCAVLVLSFAAFYVVIEGYEKFKGFIEIGGNDDFTESNGVTAGDGTAAHPYMISDVVISKAPGLVIRNTDAHVQIMLVAVRDFVEMDGSYSVTLEGVKNLTMEHVTIKNCHGGIYLRGADCEIKYCMIEDMSHETALSMMECVNCTASHNTINGVGDAAISGIQISNSRDCTVTSNSVRDSRSGIWAYDCANCSISDNHVSAPYSGLALDSSETMTVMGNFFELNGISVYGSPDDVSSHTIDVTNHVGSGPVLYFRDIDGVEIEDLTLGQLIVTNNSRFSARNITISGYQDGVQMVWVDNSTLDDIRIQGRYDSSYPRISPKGIRLDLCTDITVRSCNVSHTGIGIMMGGSRLTLENNTLVTNDVGVLGGGTRIRISGNTIIGSALEGLGLDNTDFLDFSNNTLVGDLRGMDIQYSSNVTFHDNTFEMSDIALSIYSLSDSIFYHNDFLGNQRHVIMPVAQTNLSWDAGYPAGGNYWSDYYGTDAFSGVDQDVPGADGIGDSAYRILESLDIRDNYPQMAPVVA